MEAKVRIQEFFFQTKNVEFMDPEPHRTMDVFVLASSLDDIF